MAGAAAAAAVGARHGRLNAGRLPPPSLPRWVSGYSLNPRAQTSGMRASCCLSVVLLCTGVGLVVASVGNDRLVKVQTYDAAVTDWANYGRAQFEGSQFTAAVTSIANVTDNATAGINDTNGTNESAANFKRWLPQPIDISLQANEAMNWNFRDAENGHGLTAFEALKFEAEVDLPSYYPSRQSNGSESWDPLPGLDDAPAIRISLTTRTRNGTESTLETGRIPLFYEVRALPRTPAPDTKCRTHQNGIWRNGHCYVVMALSKVCVQMETNNETGAFQFRRVNGDDGYGCDPAQDWSYTTYLPDTCWGSRRRKACSLEDPQPVQRVEVVIRSSLDPKLTAAELTRSSYDFGASSVSQQAMGAVVFALSALLALPCTLTYLAVPLCRKICRKDPRETHLEALSPAARRMGSEVSA